MSRIEDIKNIVLNGELISKEEVKDLLEVSDKESLYKAANEIRIKFMEDKFDLCSIINAKSGKCSENCKWCAQSAHYKTSINTYDIVEKDIALKLARQNAEYGVNKYSFVTSGRALSDRNIDILCQYIEEIDNKVDINICASMGLLSKTQLMKLKEAGVVRYHCNIETAPSYFNDLCTSHTTEDKIETIKAAQEVGMDVCSGGIIGMGETMEQRIEMAFLLRDLNIKSIPINILNPIPGTPLENADRLSDDDILTTIAIFRFINPDAWIRFAGGRNLINNIQDKAMQAGVNAAITGDLLTTTGATVKEDIERIKALGFKIIK
jgi:biotin synthase